MINIIVHKNAVKYRGTEKEMKPISEYLKENYPDFDYAKISTIKYFTKLKKEFYYSHDGFLPLEHKLWSC